MLYCIVLYCIVLYWTVLYSTVILKKYNNRYKKQNKSDYYDYEEKNMFLNKTNK